jgi:hypothetical protein
MSNVFTLFARVECDAITPDLLEHYITEMAKQVNEISKKNPKLYIQDVSTPHPITVSAPGIKTVLSLHTQLVFSGELHWPVRFDPNDEKTFIYTVALPPYQEQQ